jgi:hypothetical protein
MEVYESRPCRFKLLNRQPGIVTAILGQGRVFLIQKKLALFPELI